MGGVYCKRTVGTSVAPDAKAGKEEEGVEQELEVRILYAEDLAPAADPDPDDSDASLEIAELSFDIPRD